MPSKPAFLFLNTSHSVAAPKGRWLLRREIFIWMTASEGVWIECVREVCVCVWLKCVPRILQFPCINIQTHIHTRTDTHTHPDTFALYFWSGIDFGEQLRSIMQRGPDVLTWCYLSRWSVIIYCCRGIRAYTLINRCEAILPVLSPSSTANLARRMRRGVSRANITTSLRLSIK